MLLIKLAPVILLRNGYVGLNSNKFVCQYLVHNYRKMAFIVHFIFSPKRRGFQISEFPANRGITFSVLDTA